MRTTIVTMVAALLIMSGCGASGGEGSGGSTNLGGQSPGSGGSGGAPAQGGGSAQGGSAADGGGSAMGGGGSGGGAVSLMDDCTSYCQKIQTAGCGLNGCLQQCLNATFDCVDDWTSLVHCAATTGAVTCQGKTPSLTGCDAAQTAFGACEQKACYDGNGACDPTRANSCPSGKGCYWEPNDNYEFVCEAAGSHRLGESCAFGDPCAANLYCDDGASETGTCRKWCCADADCASGETCKLTAAGGAVQVKLCVAE